MLTKKALENLRADYSLFIEHILGDLTQEQYQKNLCKIIAENSRVCIRAPHSVGKTWLMARIALAFNSVYPSSKVVTSAPTHRQVELLLWGEMNKAHRLSKFPLGGKMLSTKWTIADDHWAVGFSPKKEAESSNAGQAGSHLQGIHAPYLLAIFDEATGIAADQFKQVEGLLTSGAVVKFVCIGNPTTKECEFYKCFNDPNWYKFSITCFDSPNMLANGLKNMADLKLEIDILKTMPEIDRLERLKSYRVVSNNFLRADWAVGYVLKLGFTHPLVVSKVFGDFPEENVNGLFHLVDIEKAQRRNADIPEEGERLIGVDVARYGTDMSIFNEIVGWKNTRKILFSKFDVAELSGALIRFCREGDQSLKLRVIIDGTGIGAGVVDLMKEYVSLYNLDWDIIETHFGGEPLDKEHYINKKAEMFCLLAQDLKTKLGLLDDDIYQEELPTLMHIFNSKGKTVMESKDEYKRRTGKNSPDTSDSLALSNYGRYTANKFMSFPKPSDMKRTQIKTAVY
jgi:hypothetical protein